MDLILGLQPEGLDPTSSADRKVAGAAISVRPELSLRSAVDGLRGKNSLAVSLDLCPKAVLMGGGGGIMLGALIVAHPLASGVAGLLSSLVVCYGIFKGTKNKPLPRLVAKSFRPVSVCSPLAAIEPGSAQLKLTSSQEISQFLPPSTYAYKKGFSPSMPVFAAMVAVMISLDLHQSVAIGDFDCSDAFFRVPRGELSALLDVMPDTWNFGSWAAAFFRQVQVVPVTTDGLAPPYTTGEGFN